MNFFNKRGGTFVSVLIVLVVLSILTVVVLKTSLGETKQVVYQDKGMQAFYLARSGADATSTHIIRNPSSAASLASAPVSNTNNTDFSNGSFKVDVTNGASLNDIVVTGYGEVGNITREVSVELTRLNASNIFDKAIYTDEPLNITNMVVNGDVQSAGVIEYTTNESSHNYYGDNAEPDSVLYIVLDPWPSVPDRGSLTVKQDEETIDQSGYYESISVEQNGTLTVESNTDNVQLVVDYLNIDGTLKIEASNGARVEIYVNNGVVGPDMIITTKGVINNEHPEDLIIYLADDSYLEIQAGKILNGYIIGPDATVEIQSENTIINGSIICDKIQKNENGNPANGQVNFHDINDTDILPNVLAYRIIKWSD